METVVTRQQLLERGHGHGFGETHTSGGSWLRVAPSTYLTAPPTLADRVAVALAHAGRDGVVTGWAGCLLHGMPYVPDGGPVPVLVPAGRRRVSTAYVRVLPTTRPPAWCVLDGVRVAAPYRCVVDAARALPDLRSVRALVLGSLRMVALSSLDVELAAGARGRSALCRRALSDAARGAASAPEAEFADHVVAAAWAGRLPAFLLNPDVLVAGVLIGRPDGWLMGTGLGWEIDSVEFHAGDEQFETTLARHDRFVAHGLALLHLTPRRVRGLGEGSTAQLIAAAEARRLSGTPEPAGLTLVARGPLLPPRPGDPQKNRPGMGSELA